MQEHLWYMRKHGAQFNPQHKFRLHPNIFSLKIHHGGRFTRLPGRNYVNGQISFFDMVDSDEFSVLEVDSMVHKLGYPKGEVMLYNYSIPNLALDDGLRSLGTDSDVLDLLKYTGTFKVIDLYIEHGGTEIAASIFKLSESIMQSPSSRPTPRKVTEKLKEVD